MAFWKKRTGTFEPSSFGSKHCRYGAYYLGKMQTDGESGMDCTLQPVNNMYKSFKQTKGKITQRMTVEITRQGVLMHPNDGNVSPRSPNVSPRSPRSDDDQPNTTDILLPVVDISFGTAVPGHDKVFAVVVRNHGNENGNYTWDCHGFLCDSASVSRDLTLLLVKAFQRASAAGEITQPMSVDEASKQSKPTTLHILHERGRLEHKGLQRTKSSPAVSTIRVTLNVEYNRPVDPPKPQRKGKDKKKPYVDPHKAFAEALAERDREKDIMALLDKPLKSLSSSSTSPPSAAKTSPLRRVKSESHAMRRGMAALKTDEKENRQQNMPSVQEDQTSDTSSDISKKDTDIISSDSSHDTSGSSSHTSDSEQEIVVALNPLMSILKNPSRPFREGNESSTSGTLTFKRDSPRSDNEDNGSSPEAKDAKRVKRKSVRFNAHPADVIDDQ